MSGRLWGAGGAQVHSHGQELAHPRPAPWGTGGTGRQGTALLFPTRSGTDARTGKQAAAGQAGVGFAGLQSHDLNFPSSLLSLHLTHADPLTPPRLAPLPRASAFFFWLDWGVFIRDCHLSKETLVALRMGGKSSTAKSWEQPKPSPAATPPQGFSQTPRTALAPLRPSPGTSTTSSESTELKHRLSHEI